MHIGRWLCFFVIAGLVTACGDRSSDSRTHRDSEYEARLKQFAAFKQRNLPKVGTIVTASGVLQAGKPAMWVPFEDGEIYIRPTRDEDIPKDNDLLSRFLGRHVTARGTLRHFESPHMQTDAEVPVQVPMEHFFLDVAEVTITEDQP